LRGATGDVHEVVLFVDFVAVLDDERVDEEVDVGVANFVDWKFAGGADDDGVVVGGSAEIGTSAGERLDVNGEGTSAGGFGEFAEISGGGESGFVDGAAIAVDLRVIDGRDALPLVAELGGLDEFDQDGAEIIEGENVGGKHGFVFLEEEFGRRADEESVGDVAGGGFAGSAQLVIVVIGF
jgi:hypothetical protein